MADELPFESLDFVYAPSNDAAADVEQLAAAGAEVVFAIERFGTRVAMVRLAGEGPGLALAEHLEGERPILVYRVPDLAAAAAALTERGFEVSEEFGIPHGPIRELTTE